MSDPINIDSCCPKARERYWRLPWRAGWLLALLLGLSCGVSTTRAQAPLPENQVKAAFLLNFPKYVEWPPEALPASDSPIVIIVLGANKLGEAVETMIKGKTVNGHPLVLKMVAKEEDITGDFHILFIGNSERRREPAILQKLGSASVLTVGESEDFLTNGGIINLAKEDKKISLEINLTVAHQARLKISSKLLSVARVQKGKVP